MKTFSSLRAMADAKNLDQTKLFDGLTKTNAFDVPPELVHIDYAHLLRPINQEHVDEFKKSILAKAIISPVFLELRDNRLTPIEGNHRTIAYHQLIDDGLFSGTMSAIEFKGSRSDAIMLGLVSAQGQALTPLEMAKAYAEAINEGLSQRQIAEIVGKTIAHVSQTLKLNVMDSDIQGMVKRGEVSATVAMATVKKRGTDAKNALAADIDATKKAGKKKLTGKSLNKQPDSVNQYSDKELRKLSKSAWALLDDYYNVYVPTQHTGQRKWEAATVAFLESIGKMYN
jgi:ParB family chromosome partitioning protein